MKILLLHNRYRQPGGEDAVVTAEAALLRSYGHAVREFEMDNGAETGFVRIASQCTWSRDSYLAVAEACREFRPDIAHVHNFWMRLSPSVHDACRSVGVPTVQTLHNFRLLCANANLYRGGTVCERCVGHSPWRGVVGRCYRGSFLASAAVAAMIVRNRRRGTWSKRVDAFIALSENSRRRFLAGGLSQGKVFVKSNFVEDPGVRPPPSASDAIVYAGRLSPEKGPATLVRAWVQGRLGRLGTLTLAGDGPERASLERMAAADRQAGSIRFLGHLSPPEVSALVSSARAVVAPSECMENFPRIVVEGFAHGRPAVVSDIGALAEIVNRRVGLRVPVRDTEALAGVLSALLQSDTVADRFGAAARAEYLACYTPLSNYRRLMTIYEFAMERSAGFARTTA
jgi:glycosyltransferase involved in cell wall biosynthesis